MDPDTLYGMMVGIFIGNLFYGIVFKKSWRDGVGIGLLAAGILWIIVSVYNFFASVG